MYLRVADWLKAIVLVIAFFAIYIFAGTISNTILLFIVASLIVFIIVPIINFLTLRRVNRIIAIALTYTLFLVVLAILAYMFGPIVRDQISEFAENLPGYIRSLSRFAERIQNQLANIRLFQEIRFDPDPLINQATNIVVGQLRNLISLIPSLITLLVDLVIIIALSIYILYYLPRINQIAKNSLPDGTGNVYDRFLVTMKTGLMRYILGQLSIMIAVGILSGFGVWLVGLPFPLVLGLWAGLTEIIPILGPILGAIPAVIIALTINPTLALWVILVFIVVQQTESNFLSPLIFRGTAGLNPLLTIFAVVAGAEIAGIIGIFLAVPILVFSMTLISFIRDNFAYVRVKDGPDRIVIKE